MLAFPVYLLVLLVFINRYVGGLFLKLSKGACFDAVRTDYEPTVTVVVPLYNEGQGIYDTIKSLLRQQYPEEKLSIVVVDDCSKDDSYAWAKKAEAEAPARVSVIQNPVNMGKRRGISNAVRHATSEIIVSVDSDTIVEQTAVRRLVSRFTRPELAAVGGRVHVSNPHENWLTRAQAIKYYFGYEYLKNLERFFSSVQCLSGCLTAYRRYVLIELEPVLENRNILGVPIMYGEDRYLTRQIVKAGYQTTITLDAECWTVAPNTLQKYFAQQLRWRRSNLVDFLCALTHIWRLHPLVALHYLALSTMLITYPLVIFHNLTTGAFWELDEFNLATLAVFGVVYALGTRNMPKKDRVHPIWFLGMAILMPVTYLVCTPLAIFTLDSSNWETRGGTAPKAPACAGGVTL